MGASHITTLQQPDRLHRKWLRRLRKGAILRAVPDRIEIRQPTMIDEFRACHAVQEQAWAFPELLVVPYSQLMTIHRNGGLVLCAFDGTAVVGFVYGFLGRRAQDKVYLFSQRLGVLPSHQGKGIGARLKWAQRAWALRQGLDRIVWTYDPLEAPNAQLNIAKLGGIARHYERDAYGQRDGAEGKDLPTDRLLLEWELLSERVLARLEPGWSPPSAQGFLAQAGHPLNAVSWDLQGLAHCERRDLSRVGSLLLLEVPANWRDLCQADAILARDWHANAGLALEHYLEQGYALTGYAQGHVAGQRRNFYRLEKPEWNEMSWSPT